MSLRYLNTETMESCASVLSVDVISTIVIDRKRVYQAAVGYIYRTRHYSSLIKGVYYRLDAPIRLQTLIAPAKRVGRLSSIDGRHSSAENESSEKVWGKIYRAQPIALSLRIK